MSKYLAVSLLFGIVYAGCNESHRKYPPHTVTSSPANTSVPQSATPAEPTSGRLITGHAIAQGLGDPNIKEPFAPPGQWVTASWGFIWFPDYLKSFPTTFYAIQDEIRITEAKWEPDRDPVVPGLGPELKTRVIIIPGPTFACGDLLVSGLIYPKSWKESDGSFSDVLIIGVTDSATRSIAPSNHSYKLYAPSAGHEIAHQRTGILTHEHR